MLLTVKRCLLRQTVYTIGNGYFGTRGAFEEGYPHATPATLLFGVFDTITIGKEELANVPDLLPLQLFVNGERFRLDLGKVLAYQRTLNMKNGTLYRFYALGVSQRHSREDCHRTFCELSG